MGEGCYIYKIFIITLFLDYFSEHVSTVKGLADLHILIDQTLSGSLGWKLNETFKTSLKVALLGGYVRSLVYFAKVYIFSKWFWNN